MVMAEKEVGSVEESKGEFLITVRNELNNGNFDEAKRVYKQIIKKRGIGDTWGIEAQKRLEIIQ